MSHPTKVLTLSRIEDLTLGSFAFVPSSATLDHLVRFLSTWSGSDKLFMVMQYGVKLLAPFLHLRARLQHRAGMRPAPTSRAADGLVKFSSILGDARMLFRIWGLLPIIQWLISIERNRPPTRQLLTIERLQGWSMLAYYPLEHLYYLLSHAIVPAELPTNPLSSLLPCTKASAKDGGVSWDTNALGLWSCRYWALYVLLQFVHLREDNMLLKMRQRTVNKSKTTAAQIEKDELKKRFDALRTEFVVNLAYLPMTLHWSLEKGLFKNAIWIDICGFIAALASWRSGWKATELSPPTPTVDVSTDTLETEKEAERNVAAAASLDKGVLGPLTMEQPLVTVN
ncbi:hypothetical protein BKA93DRAFT_467088 [Sparassis latifolia]